MRYEIQRSGPTGLCLSITADREEVDAAMQRSPERSREELADTLTCAVLEKERLNPVSRPVYDGGMPEAGREYAFTATFDVLPDMHLPDFAELEVRVSAPEPDAEEMRRPFLELLRRHATLSRVEEHSCPQEGDVLSVDIRGESDGQALPGMQARSFRLRMEAKGSMPELCGILRGLHCGEEGTGEMQCPENYPIAEFRGRPVRLTVRLLEIWEEKLPRFDDAFAVKLGFRNIAELERKLVSEGMARHLKATAAKAKRQLLDELLSKENFSVPAHIGRMFRQEEFREAERFMKSQGLDEEAAFSVWKQEAVKRADKAAKAHCFLLALAFREGLSVPEKELEAHLTLMAGEEGAGELRKRLEREGTLSDVQERLLAARAMDLLYRRARKIVVDGNGRPMNAQ